MKYQTEAQLVPTDVFTWNTGLRDSLPFCCVTNTGGSIIDLIIYWFVFESSDVPVWMFLDWVNQLLACLNTPIGPVLHDLVRSLAQTYPQAIIYGFQVSQENYELGREQPDLKNFVDE